jgi:hypothetical protein
MTTVWCCRFHQDGLPVVQPCPPGENIRSDLNALTARVDKFAQMIGEAEGTAHKAEQMAMQSIKDCRDTNRHVGNQIDSINRLKQIVHSSKTHPIVCVARSVVLLANDATKPYPTEEAARLFCCALNDLRNALADLDREPPR